MWPEAWNEAKKSQEILCLRKDDVPVLLLVSFPQRQLKHVPRAYLCLRTTVRCPYKVHNVWVLSKVCSNTFAFHVIYKWWIKIKKEGEEGRDIANHFANFYNVRCVWEKDAGSMDNLLFHSRSTKHSRCWSTLEQNSGFLELLFFALSSLCRLKRKFSFWHQRKTFFHICPLVTNNKWFIKMIAL